MEKKNALMVVLDAVSTAAIVVAVVVLVWRVTRLAEPAAPAPPAAPSPVASVTGRIAPSVLTNVQGRGPVAIVEFTDFECSFCGFYARKTLPAVKRDLVDSGRVRYAVLNFPLEGIHPLAEGAAMAAECAARQGKYWQMHDRLFADGAGLEPAALPAHAAALALDSRQFAACMSGEVVAKVRADVAEARRLGVPGTPAFFVGTVSDDGSVDLHTRIRGAADVGILRQAVEASARLSRTRPR